MNYLNVTLAIATCCTGLLAAYFWYKASVVPINPGEGINSGDFQMQEMAWMVATMEAVIKSAELNKIAARWTAIAVMLGTAYNFFEFMN